MVNAAAGAVAEKTSCCSCDLVSISSVASIAIAVAGVALSILTGQIHFLIGFALLGGLALIMGIKGAANSQELKRITNQLQTVDNQVDAQMEELRQRLAQLQRDIQTEKEENGKLQQAAQQWTAAQQQFQASVQQLGQKEELEKQEIAALQQISPAFKSLTETWLAHLSETEQTVGAFNEQTSSLGAQQTALRKALSSLQTALNGNNPSQLSQAIQDTSKEFSEHLSQERAELKTLRDSVSELKATENSLKEQIGQLAGKEKEIQQVASSKQELVQAQQALVKAYQERLEEKKRLDLELDTVERSLKMAEGLFSYYMSLAKAKAQALSALGSGGQSQSKQ